MSEVGAKVEEFLEKNKEHLRNPDEPDRIFAKGRKIEGVFLIISHGIPLFRTEGVEDITRFAVKVDNEEYIVPSILPEKIQGKMRRVGLEILRNTFTPSLSTLLDKYDNEGYTKAKKNEGVWNCYVAPTMDEKEMDIGMCNFCPICMTFGTIIGKNDLKNATTTYGVKSRVLHEVAFATTIFEKAVSRMMHNKVGEGVSYTGRSLYPEYHVQPGVVFIGKVTLCDVTKNEAKLLLSILSSVRRLGARETKDGSVQVVLLGLKTGLMETISSYTITRAILKKYLGDLKAPEIVTRDVIDILERKGFSILLDKERVNLDPENTLIPISHEEIAEIWEKDNYEYARQISRQILKVIQKSGKKRGKGESGEEESDEEGEQ